ncbi:hypothetical protein IEQ34_019841 [Dendrobium chrysotoxum]|uniref:Uncharacterized protein n=1 Tax=Dendrobium chrysotoxum TaxID=161865 RepID=A0AAV7G9V2_DENCH|nr:hypothetical protein IEQ34_019841 [Dendrobium chrysotoxum]
MLRLSSVCIVKWSHPAARAGSFTLPLPVRRGFRSPAALEALEAHIGEEERGQKKPQLVLYNYPSFGGAFAALFAHLYHSALNLPCLVLPFSSVDPLRVADLRFGDIRTCYMLDFVGPKNFAVELAKIIPRVIAFDHRLCTLSRISNMGKCPSNLELRIDTRKSTARASLDYFSEKLTEEKSSKKFDLMLELCLNQVPRFLSKSSKPSNEILAASRRLPRLGGKSRGCLPLHATCALQVDVRRHHGSKFSSIPARYMSV